MAGPTYFIVIRSSWQQSAIRSVDGVMMCQQVAGKPKLDVFGFLGRALGIRDDMLEKGGSIESIVRRYPKTERLWPKISKELENRIHNVNDYEPAEGKEGKLKDLFAQVGITVYFVNTNTEAEQLRASLEKKQA